MRKIEQEMNEAIANGNNWQKDNTAIIFTRHHDELQGAVYLHNNMVAHITPGKTIVPVEETFRQYPTRTTASRLRGLGVDARIKNSRPMINDQFI